MKKLSPFVIAILFALPFLSSCKKDKCLQTVTYKRYEPVYMSYDELRSSVNTLPAQPLKKPGKIYLKGNYIFVSEVNKGIHVIDNTNPSSPVQVSFINIPGNVDIAAKGNVLYADSYIDLLAIDITNPAQPHLLNRIENALPQRHFMGHYADPQKGVVTDWAEKEVTEEVSNDCHPGGGYWGPVILEGDVVAVSNTFSGTTTTTTGAPGIGGSMARFTISGNTLYVVDDQNLRIFDISTASSPVSAGTSFIGRNIETIFPYQNHLFIGSTNGMFIYNINNPLAPSYVSTYVHGTACDPVVVDGNYAYVTLRSGTPCNTTLNQLEVVNIQNIANPVLSHTVPMVNPHGLGKDGKHLFICDGADGLKVLDAGSPTTIPATPVVHLSNAQATDVIPYNKKLLLIGTDGLYQYDYSNMPDLNFLSRIPVQQ